MERYQDLAFRTAYVIVRDTADSDLAAIAERARARVLAEHTAERRAEQLEREVDGLVRAAA